MEKISLPKASELTSPNPVTIVCTQKPDGGTNLATVSWWTYLSFNPSMIAYAMAKTSYSGEMVRGNKKVVLTIPGAEIADAVMGCGMSTGRDTDKIANKVVREWLETQGFTEIVPEYTYGNSRIDFYMEKGAEKYLLEVKGCTLEVDGIGYFPDAPTERGVKPLRELAKATGNGYHAAVAFVIQMDGVTEVRPNTATHPAFGAALQEAWEAGVEVVFLQCHVEPDTLTIHKVIKRT